MALSRVVLTNFRNIQHSDVVLDGVVHLFCGANGSGKTSLLEAVHTLASGRSFRSRQSQSLIRYGAESLAVFGRLRSGVALGVEKLRDGKGRIRINQLPASSSSELAACLPLQVINSDSFSALDGGPGVRRQLLDWTVFHVEHSFSGQWKVYQSALKQRNALLRRGKIDSNLLAPWEQQLLSAGEVVHRGRYEVFQRLKVLFKERLDELPRDVFGDLDVQYRSGWKRELSLAEALESSRSGDCEQGFTRIGPHRADLRFSINGQPAEAVLSRGQQKMAVCALRTAMAATVGGSEKPLFLVDDLPAELDDANQALFARWVRDTASQVLVTGIDPETTQRAWKTLDGAWGSPQMFHVEHGRVEDFDLSG
ncbi:DNA replication/repair protein RecF [Microbulbifer agarilyticus]|uniref:DNA replication/repair protein RecF n=1 Tax=Microbulbifer agarilyticus TaxID=260552 RepID=UPI001CD56A8C|nr:DNA replication/repair protein RecF [Microbulbifer agarilyticus]MCA0893548.1 DNA replication/repair protein RecF [Microbulbifer agarilyticus]